jgi:SAM-dependent methyltransferase
MRRTSRSPAIENVEVGKTAERSRGGQNHASMARGKELEPVDAEYAEAEQFVDGILPRGAVLKVLDIKAGEQRFEIRRPIYVVGVDVLQAERGRRVDADEHRVMDLEEVDLESDEYDVVLCVNVLEHARQPKVLLYHVSKALKPGGTFVIVVPNVASLKSFVVRLVPWTVQCWFYTRVLRGDDYPARAVHRFSLRPNALVRQAHLGGWKVEYFRTYEGPVQRRVRHRFGIVGWRWKAIVAVTRVVTLGLLTADDTGIIAVFTKLPLG